MVLKHLGLVDLFRKVCSGEDLTAALEQFIGIFPFRALSLIHCVDLGDYGSRITAWGVNVESRHLRCIEETENFLENHHIRYLSNMRQPVIVEDESAYTDVPLVGRQSVIFPFANLNRRRLSILCVDLLHPVTTDKRILNTTAGILPFLHYSAVLLDSNACQHYFLGLTPREQDVLSLVLEGKSNKEIARIIGFTERAAKHHLTRLMEKTGSSSRTHLATKAIRSGLY